MLSLDHCSLFHYQNILNSKKMFNFPPALCRHNYNNNYKHCHDKIGY